MPLSPNTNTPGLVLVSKGTGQNDSVWAALILPYTYSVSGTLAVPSGATNYLPPFFVPGNMQLLSVIGMTRSGSLTLEIQYNGSNIGGLTGLTIDTTPSTNSPTDQVNGNAGDYFAPVITSVSGADGLSLTFFFQV
jgi:hypothetical protein